MIAPFILILHFLPLVLEKSEFFACKFSNSVQRFESTSVRIRLRGRVVLACFTMKLKQEFVVNTMEQDDAFYLYAFFDVVDGTKLKSSNSLPRTVEPKPTGLVPKFNSLILTSLISFTTSLGLAHSLFVAVKLGRSCASKPFSVSYTTDPVSLTIGGTIKLDEFCGGLMLLTIDLNEHIK